MKPLSKLEKDIIRKVVNIVDTTSVNCSEKEYRRLLGHLIKRLYAIRNINYEKVAKETDFDSENNPSKKRRLNQITSQTRKHNKATSALK